MAEIRPIDRVFGKIHYDHKQRRIDPSDVTQRILNETIYIYMLHDSWYEVSLIPFNEGSPYRDNLVEMSRAMASGGGEISRTTEEYYALTYFAAPESMRPFYVWEYPILTSVGNGRGWVQFSRANARYNRVWRELGNKVQPDWEFVDTFVERSINAETRFVQSSWNYALWLESEFRPVGGRKYSEDSIKKLTEEAIKTSEGRASNEKAAEWIARCFINDVCWINAFLNEYNYRPDVRAVNTKVNIEQARVVSEEVGLDAEKLLQEAINEFNVRIIMAQEIINKNSDASPNFDLLRKRRAFEIGTEKQDNFEELDELKRQARRVV